MKGLKEDEEIKNHLNKIEIFNKRLNILENKIEIGGLVSPK